MSRRWMPRTAKKRPNYVSDSDFSESESDLVGILEALIASRRSKPKSRRRSAKSPRQQQVPSVSNVSSPKPKNIPKTAGKKNTTVAEPIAADSEEEKVDENTTANHLKLVETKVDNFFKSGSLLSDDEENESTPQSPLPPKESKEFYTLSDSDEEIDVDKPSTSSVNPSKCIKNVNNSVELEQNNSRGDELMDIVDKIFLNCDDVPEVPKEADQSWSEYKNKAQEILGNISTLLHEITEDTKPQEKPKDPEPDKTKQICPICLEVLGGEVLAMTTICGHIFCKECITHVAKTSRACPTCRKNVTLKKIHALYL